MHELKLLQPMIDVCLDQPKLPSKAMSDCLAPIT